MEPEEDHGVVVLAGVFLMPDNGENVKKARVFVASKSACLLRDLESAFDWLGISLIVSRGSRVFLKPNLTWKKSLPGVTTTPEFIAAVVATLRELRKVLPSESRREDTKASGRKRHSQAMGCTMCGADLGSGWSI